MLVNIINFDEKFLIKLSNKIFLVHFQILNYFIIYNANKAIDHNGNNHYMINKAFNHQWMIGVNSINIEVCQSYHHRSIMHHHMRLSAAIDPTCSSNNDRRNKLASLFDFHFFFCLYSLNFFSSTLSVSLSLLAKTKSVKW